MEKATIYFAVSSLKKLGKKQAGQSAWEWSGNAINVFFLDSDFANSIWGPESSAL
jgi:hypothetical protein